MITLPMGGYGDETGRTLGEALLSLVMTIQVWKGKQIFKVRTVIMVFRLIEVR